MEHVRQWMLFVSLSLLPCPACFSLSEFHKWQQTCQNKSNIISADGSDTWPDSKAAEWLPCSRLQSPLVAILSEHNSVSPYICLSANLLCITPSGGQKWYQWEAQISLNVNAPFNQPCDTLFWKLQCNNHDAQQQSWKWDFFKAFDQPTRCLHYH